MSVNLQNLVLGIDRLVRALHFNAILALQFKLLVDVPIVVFTDHQTDGGYKNFCPVIFPFEFGFCPFKFNSFQISKRNSYVRMKWQIPVLCIQKSEIPSTKYGQAFLKFYETIGGFHSYKYSLISKR